jgi:hypothetical protein
VAKNSYPLSYVANELNKILSELVTDYEVELSGKAAEITEKVATDFAEKLKQATPRSNIESGDPHLADTVKMTGRLERSVGGKRKKIYVHYGKWQIAHLLEFGWTLRNGQRLERTPFVRPLFDNNKERYFQMYKEGLSGI